MPSPFDLLRGRPQSRYEAPLRAIRDEELRRGLLTVFETARRRAKGREIDVVVLASRRLACVYQLLVGGGMPPLEAECDVISDQFLDIPGKWNWNKVLVVDDSIFGGATLLRICTEIKHRLGGDSGAIDCLAVCVDQDQDQAVDYLREAVNLDCLYERATAQVNAFVEQVVEALFIGGVPFFSDFPTTMAIGTTEQRWRRYLAGERWYATDVTAPLFAHRAQQAYTQVPTEATTRRILSRLPVEVAQLVDILKLRSYVSGDDGRHVNVRLVPIAMLVPCSPYQLNNALTALANSQPVANWLKAAELSLDSWSPIAKHRLVQMYVATCVLAEAVTAADNDHPEFGTGKLDPRQVRFYFGPHAPLIDKLIDGILEGFRVGTGDEHFTVAPAPFNRPISSPLLQMAALRTVLWENREIIASTGAPKKPDPGQLTTVGLVFGHAVSSIFGQINEVFEIPERRAIRALHRSDEYCEQYPASGRALSEGLTMRELTAALLPDSLVGSSWDRALISLGIDIGNDLGIIVPVTQYDAVRDVVYRCYRPGETAALAMTPLAQAVRTGQWDSYCKAAANGVPLRNVTSDLAAAQAHYTSVDSDDPFAILRGLIERAVPGDIVSLADGEVVEVGRSHFAVHFNDTAGYLDQSVQIPMTQLSDEDRVALTEGSLVAWTVFHRNAVGVPDRISRLRLRHEAPFDDVQFSAALGAATAG